MRLFFLIVFLFVQLDVSFAQQNFFNVPTFEITEKDKVFVQEQLNSFQSIESNTTFDYGLGKDHEIGFNIYGAIIQNNFAGKFLPDSEVSKYKDMFLINYQAKVWQNQFYSLGFGTQIGIRNLQNGLFFANMTYAAFSANLTEKVYLSVGPWFADSHYLKETDAVGIQAGAEYKIIKNQFHIIADSISGDTPISVSVFGLSYFVHKHFPISLGWQIPNWHGAGQALVMELTYREND